VPRERGLRVAARQTLERAPDGSGPGDCEEKQREAIQGALGGARVEAFDP
jgi:hypothetical protein